MVEEKLVEILGRKVDINKIKNPNLKAILEDCFELVDGKYIIKKAKETANYLFLDASAYSNN